MQQCNQYNENGRRHGYWEQQYPNGEIYYNGYYNNNIMVGYWIKFKKEYYYARM